MPNATAVSAFLLVYVGLEWVSFLHEYKGVPVTPWNPGLGVAFALLVQKGPVYGVALFAGVLIAEVFVLQTQLGWPIILAIAVVVSGSYAAAAAVARRHMRLDIGLSHVRDILVLLAVGVAGATCSAILLSLLLLAAGELSASDLMRSALPLFVGDTIGIAVMTPLMLRLSLHWREVLREDLTSLIYEVALFALATGTALWMVVGSSRPNDYKYFSLLFLPVVSAAVRHGIDGSCLALAATQVGLVAMLYLYGYDAAIFTEFQLVMLVLTMTGLLIGVVVSERRQADTIARQAGARLKEMQAEASQAARANIVSGMASALAHEINQPMTAARALARASQELLRSPDVDLKRADSNLKTVIAQIDHAGAVVRRMREFLRRGQPHFSTLDVKALLDNSLMLAQADAALHKIRLELKVADALPAVFGDSIQLQQVMLNLVRNAVDSIAETRRHDGRILIRAWHTEKGDRVEISVTDNGAGIPPGRPLFEALSTSKSEGLGLGLAISASIVEAHAGRIWLQSSDAEATEFRISLPVQKPGNHT